MKNKGLIWAALLIFLGVVLVAIFLPNGDDEMINFNIQGNETTLSGYSTTNPVVAMYIDNYGTIVMELYPDVAPNTVNNFISLIRAGYYDNNTIHRVQNGFVIQGGDRTGTGNGGPGYYIKGEFSDNGFQNDLKHEKGVLSMARSSSPDSAGSQFFIMLDKNSSLDGRYAAFGKVIDGMDVVDAIEKNETDVLNSMGMLRTPITIRKTIMDLKGKTYPQPEKVK